MAGVRRGKLPFDIDEVVRQIRHEVKGFADAAHRVEHMHRALRDVRDLLPAHSAQLGRA